MLDSASGDYLGTIDTVIGRSSVKSVYTQSDKSGWYKLCLKANASKNDEIGWIPVYLEEGKKYYYSINVIRDNSKKYIVNYFEFYGTAF